MTRHRPLVWVAGLVLTAACSQEPDGFELLERGIEALEAGSPQAALVDLEAALAALPPDGVEHAEAANGCILARVELGLEETAQGFLEWAAENPYVVRTADYVALGQRFLTAGRPGPALDLLEAGLRTEPEADSLGALAGRIRYAFDGREDAAQGFWMLGEIELEHFERAREPKWLSRALAAFVGSLENGGASPEDRLRANLGQGWCYFWRGQLESTRDFESPRAIFEQVLIGFPDSADALVGLGTCLTHLSRLDEAEEALRRALELDPDLAQGWFNLGQVHVRRVAWKQAGTAFERAAAARPAQAETLVWRAIALAESGGDAQPRKLLGRALELEPEHVEAMIQLGLVHARARRFDKALPWFERALQLDLDNGNAYLQRGKVQMALFDVQKAAASLHEACNLLPESFEAHYNLGALLANLGAHADALVYLELALELEPAGPNAGALQGTIDEIKGRIALEGR